jgi:hypothetical protein
VFLDNSVIAGIGGMMDRKDRRTERPVGVISMGRAAVS